MWPNHTPYCIFSSSNKNPGDSYCIYLLMHKIIPTERLQRCTCRVRWGSNQTQSEQTAQKQVFNHTEQTNTALKTCGLTASMEFAVVLSTSKETRWFGCVNCRSLFSVQLFMCICWLATSGGRRVIFSAEIESYKEKGRWRENYGSAY